MLPRPRLRQALSVASVHLVDGGTARLAAATPGKMPEAISTLAPAGSLASLLVGLVDRSVPGSREGNGGLAEYLPVYGSKGQAARTPVGALEC